MTSLRYKTVAFSHHQDFTLEWRAHAKGAELFQTGRGFMPDGFSLGVYGQADLAAVLLRLEAYLPGNVPHVPREGCYNHICPVKYARGQGPATRLAVCLIEPFNWTAYSYRPAFVTLHEQGERDPYRSLGSYSLESVVHFLRHAVRLCEAQHEPV